MTIPADNRPMGTDSTATVTESPKSSMTPPAQAAIPLSAGKPMCPHGHLMKGRRCSICTYESAPPPPAVEIHWGGKTRVMENSKEALKAGFHLD